MKSVKKVLRKVQDFGKSLKGVYVKCKKVVTEIGKQSNRFLSSLFHIERKERRF